MNRIIEGTGVSCDYGKDPFIEEQKKERRERTYVDFGKALGIE